MEDYYVILGINHNATEDEIKNAYRKLIKENHPDKFMNNPAARAIAEEKMRKIIEAYKYVTTHLNSNNTYSETYTKSKTYSNTNASYKVYYNNFDQTLLDQAREKINMGNYFDAENLLVRVVDKKSSEWHFLTGLIFFKQTWYAKSEEHLLYAYRMNPNNIEYKNAYNALLKVLRYMKS